MRRAHRGGVSLLTCMLAGAGWLGTTGAPAPAYAATTCATTTAPAVAVADRATVPWSVAAAGLDRLAGLADGRGVTVAVIDSGVRPIGPLAGRVVSGYDLIGTTDGRQDCVGHGTAVASIIAAQPVNGVGFRGLAPGVTILPVRVSEAEIVDGEPTGSATNGAGLASAIRDAVRRHAQVINLSLVLSVDVAAVRRAVADAVAAGVVVVASVGNGHRDSGRDPTPYPAAYPGVIGVGAIDPDGVRSPGSEVGTFVKVVAPGGSVVAQRLPSGLTVVDGTSFAVPYVAATAALVRQAYPELTAAQVTARILATADPPVTGGPRDEYGSGVIDPYRAVTEVVADRAGGLATGGPGTRPTARPVTGAGGPSGAGPSARPGGDPSAPGAEAGGVAPARPGHQAAVAWSALVVTMLALVVAALATGAARNRPTDRPPGR